MNSLNRASKQDTTPPTQDQIALRAHQLWIEEGCPQGHDVENWLEAERQLSEDFRSSSGTNQDPRQTDLTPAREDVPYSAFDSEAPLATKVAEQVLDPGRPESRRSKTSLEIDSP